MKAWVIHFLELIRWQSFIRRMHQLSWPGGQITSAACDLRGCTTLGCAALSILKIVLLIRVLEYCVYPIDLTKVEHFVTLKGNKEGSRGFFCPATTCIIFSLFRVWSPRWFLWSSPSLTTTTRQIPCLYKLVFLNGHWNWWYFNVQVSTTYACKNSGVRLPTYLICIVMLLMIITSETENNVGILAVPISYP